MVRAGEKARREKKNSRGGDTEKSGGAPSRTEEEGPSA